MAQELAVLEHHLKGIRPGMDRLVLPIGASSDRIIQSILVACERNAQLLACTPVSVCQGAMSLAWFGLEADGFSGQGYLLPFNDRNAGVKKAQAVIGVRGYNTIGARSGLTITGGVVREGEPFEFELGTDAFVRHKPQASCFENRITEAWACATSHGRPAAVAWMPIAEILQIRDNSPGYKFGSDSPWKNPRFFPAMVEKTPRRRLARSLPMSAYQHAAAMESAHEDRGLRSWMHPDKGLIIEGEADAIAEAQPGNPQGPAVDMLTRDRFVIQGRETQRRYPTIEQWRSAMLQTIETLKREPALELYELNARYLDEYRREHPHEVAEVGAVFEKKRDS